MNKGVKIYLFVISLVCICTTLFADMYSWTDENGVKHYTNVNPSQSLEDVEKNAEIVSTGQNKKADTNKMTTANDNKKNSQDRSDNCRKSLERCKEQHISSYNANVKLCEGDWSAASALEKQKSARELYNACKKDFEDRKQAGIKSCEKSYTKCMQ